MALPRPVLFALAGLALCLAAFVAARGAGGGESDAPAPPTPNQAATARGGENKPAGRSKAESRRDRSRPAPATPPNSDTGAAAPNQSGGSAVAAATDLAAVDRALQNGKAVLLFFSDGRSSDDLATSKSVWALRSRRVLVLERDTRQLADFSRDSGVQVSQTPSVVVMAQGSEPRLLEGYVDEGTLRQQVADVLR